MSNVILRSEAWKKIESGETFDLGFITADRRRGTGGVYIEVKGWQRVSPREDAKEISQTPVGSAKRSPNHLLHKTFNIQHPTNRAVHIHKVHYRLFDRFNGKTVIQ